MATGTTFQSVFGQGQEPTLSVEERLAATSRGIQRGTELGFDPLPIAVAALALLAAGFAAWLLARRLRARQWLEHHASRLAQAGLHPAEVELFRAVAACARAAVVPFLARARGVFDGAAAELVLRAGAPARRRERLDEVIALRRRIPFDARLAPPPALERGAELDLWLRFESGDPVRLHAFVLATPPHALQLAVEHDDAARAAEGALQAGQDVLLVCAVDGVLHEARVRVRGRVVGRSVQLLVDRPAAMVPARVRIGWRGADEAIRVELVERFSERVVGDAIPCVDARIVETAVDGLLIEFESLRPRHGEVMRIVAGAYAGFCRGFACLAQRGRGGLFYVQRRGGERAEPPASSPLARSRHEVVA